MRVCPECGYIDPPEWRHHRWSYWIDICHIEDFKRLLPKLAEELLKGVKLVEDKDNIYRLYAKGRKFVQRKAKVDYGYQWEPPMESVNHNPFKSKPVDFRKHWFRFSENQKKLGDFPFAP